MKALYTSGLKFRQQFLLFLMIIVIGSAFNDLFSQNIGLKPTRQSSFEAFSKGNYEQAYKEFSELLITYSKDPLYKYYSGVCLVKLKKKPDEAEALLKQALQSSGVIRNLPSDALFYLGRAQQMNGKYQEAAGSFNLFTEQAGRKVAKESGVPEFIKQCNEKQGMIVENEIKPEEKVKSISVEPVKTETKPIVKEVIQPSIGKDISLKNDLSVVYEKILKEALDFQFKADSITTFIASQKKKLEKLPIGEKAAFKTVIADNELLAASFQNSADQKYHEAELIMNPVQKTSDQKETIKISDISIPKDSVNKSERIPPIKTINQFEKKVIPEADTHSDKLKNALVSKKPVETFAYFEVLQKPITNPVEKILIDPEVPAGLIYRIQVAVFRNPVSPAYFMGITPIFGFKPDGTGKTNYYAGMFRRSSDAKKALLVVKTKGFKDAFIVPFTGTKVVSADRAAMLEKEWGRKPFITMVNSMAETPVDTVPPALSFRVEVIRSSIPLKDDVVEGIRKMSGNRGLDIQSLDDGKIVYIVGKFITFESASEYANLLVKNGYSEAKVVARLGKKEIPVETAKQLFDDMK